MRLVFQLILTAVLGIISVITLVLVLKVKDTKMTGTLVPETSPMAQPEPANQEQPMEQDELEITNTLTQIDDLKLQDIENDYSPAAFEDN